MKSFSVKILLFTMLACTAFLAQSCLTLFDTQAAQKPEERRRILLRTIPETAPEWKDTVPHDEKKIYFTGVSRAFRTEADARNAAREDARRQILLYYGQYIKSISKESSNFKGNSNDILNPYIERVDELTSFAESVVKQINANRYYTEVFQNINADEEFIVYVLCQIDRERAEQEINTFAERVSARYRALIDAAHGKKTLTSTLEAFQSVRSSLSKNPLERVVAFYQTEQGNSGLYDYCTLMINSLSQNITIGIDKINSGKPYRFKKGDDIQAIIKVSPNEFNVIGAARCKVLVMGADAAEIPEALYTVGAENSFSLILHTKYFFTGNYNVYIELLLNEYAPDVKRNPEYGFSFTVFSNLIREENPLLLPAGEHWEGMTQYVFNGKSYTDVYSLLFDETGLCRIVLKQDSSAKRTGNGTWTISGEILEINCAISETKSFPKRVIEWSSLYRWDVSKNSFSMLVPPYQGAQNKRVVFVRVAK